MKVKTHLKAGQNGGTTIQANSSMVSVSQSNSITLPPPAPTPPPV